MSEENTISKIKLNGEIYHFADEILVNTVNELSAKVEDINLTTDMTNGTTDTITIGSKIGSHDEDGYYLNHDGIRMPTGWDPGWSETTTLSEALSIIATHADASEASNVDFRRFTVQSVNGIMPNTDTTTDGAITIYGSDISISSDINQTITNKFEEVDSEISNLSKAIVTVNGIGYDSFGTSDITITGYDISLSAEDSTTILDKFSELENRMFTIRLDGSEVSITQEGDFESGYMNYVDLSVPTTDEVKLGSNFIEYLGIDTSEYNVNTMSDFLNLLQFTYRDSNMFLNSYNVDFSLQGVGYYDWYLKERGFFNYEHGELDASSYDNVYDCLSYLLGRLDPNFIAPMPDWINLNRMDENGNEILCNTKYIVCESPGYIAINVSSEQAYVPVSLEINDIQIFSNVHNCVVPISVDDTFNVICSIEDHSINPIEISFIPAKVPNGTSNVYGGFVKLQS